MRQTQRKGDIGVTSAIAAFTKMGYDVSLPITESASYDLIVDDGNNQLFRVQCKYSSNKEVDLRKIHHNSKGYVVNGYKKDSYDWLYVFGSDGQGYLIRRCLTQSTYTLQDSDKI